MRGALRHPLVGRLLGAIVAVVSARDGVDHAAHGVMPSDLGLDAFWKSRGGYPRGRDDRGNGSARVRRAAQKARNVKRNRRAHRG